MNDAGARGYAGILACFVLSGFAALLYQTAWLRQFSIVFGTSELAVAAVLASYMGGLALGSFIAARYIGRVRRPVLVYGAMDVINEKNGNSLELVEKALGNVAPAVEVKSRRVGGSTYQVPVEVRPNRRRSLAIRWLIGFGKSRAERTMREKLAGEFLDAANERGGAMKKKDDVHRMAEANKAFAHYRF